MNYTTKELIKIAEQGQKSVGEWTRLGVDKELATWLEGYSLGFDKLSTKPTTKEKK